MLFTTAYLPALCLNCSHGTCEACPVNEFVCHGHDLSSHKSTYEGPSNSLGRIQPTLLSLDQVRDVDGHNEQELRGQVQHERDHEQENQVEPHREHLKEPQSSSISERKKRKLNMTKCQRCRYDKKACIRQISGKCNRCTEKGLLCSEGTRVTRPRKLPSKSSLPTHDKISPPINSGGLEISFDQIALLVSYYQMMKRAEEQLNKLDKAMKLFFGRPSWHTYKSSVVDFRLFVSTIYVKAILLCLTRLSTEKQFPKTLPTRSSLISLILATDSLYMADVCPFCEKTDNVTAIYGLSDSVDLCRNFVFKEHLIDYHGPELNKDKLEEEIQMYTTLLTEVPQKIGVVFESLGCSELAQRSRAIGLYHHDSMIWWDWKILILRTGDFDCLKRTALHRMLDGAFEDYEDLSFILKQAEHLWDDVSVWNSQDILGRTPLYILCQFEEDEDLVDFMQKVLEAGPDLGLATIYGTIPLHRAAANGSIELCKALVERGGKFDVGAEDCDKRTALDHAVVKKHQDVVNLLTDCYIEAGLEEKVAKALRIATAVREGTYRIYYSYGR